MKVGSDTLKKPSDCWFYIYNEKFPTENRLKKKGNSLNKLASVTKKI